MNVRETAPLYLLMVEGDPSQSEAIQRAFAASEMLVGIRVVEDLAGYRAALAERSPDLALVNFHLKDGCALEILGPRARSATFPILVMTNEGNEQEAVQIIKAGALDYVVKSPEAFATMPRTVRSALREWKLQQSHRLAEEALKESQEVFQQFMEHVPIYVFFKDENIRPIRLSRNYEQLLGRPLGEIIGRDMTELFPGEMARAMIELDRKILAEGKPVVVNEELAGRFYTTHKFSIYVDGKPRFLAGYTIDVTDRKTAEAQLLEKNAQLEEALSRVKALRGLLPICSGCKKIRDDKGYWSQVDKYIQEHSSVIFTHSLCPECIAHYYPTFANLPPDQIDGDSRSQG